MYVCACMHMHMHVGASIYMHFSGEKVHTFHYILKLLLSLHRGLQAHMKRTILIYQTVI